MNDFQRVAHQEIVGSIIQATQATNSAASGIKTIRLDLGVDEDSLLGSLSDGATLFLVGEVPDLQQRLQKLESMWTERQKGIASSDAETEVQGEAAWLESFGTELFTQLLPGRLRAYFKDASPCRLEITADVKLAGVPWESAFDGRHHWQDVHAISRSVLGHGGAAEPGQTLGNRPSNRVLLDCVGITDPTWEHYGRNLQSVLTANTNLTVEHTDVPIPETTDWDIIHVVDSPDHFVQRSQADPQFTQRLQKSRLVILDWQTPGSDGDAWALEGKAIASALTFQERLICIKRAAGTPPDAPFVHTLYAAIVDVEKTTDSQKVSRFPASVTVSQYGDNLVGRFTREPASEPLRSFRQVTALSYDLVGSTQLMHTIGMEQYSVSLREYHLSFGAVITRWGGLFHEPQGNDGAMCYFGAEHAREDTIRCALYAARELLTEAQRMNLRVRIGLATGQTAVTADHLVGPCIHLAARIQTLAPVGVILVSDSTADLARPYFTLTAFDHDQELKGFPGPNRVFSLGTPKLAESAGFDAGLNSTLLYGRQAEMAQLDSQWALARQGRSRWLHITGEAGIGKSRLVATFVKTIQHQGDVKTFTCRCYAETAGRAFGPIIDMLERRFQIRSNDDAKTRQAKLAQSAAESGVSPEDHLAISYLMGLPAPQSHSPESPETHEPRRRFLMRTMAAWLLNQARDHPLCFVLEDLQWADPSTLDYLRRLRSESTGCKLVVILTERTEQSPAVLNAMTDHAIRLGRLPSTAAREMISSLTTGSSLTRQLTETIEAKSDGIPLFIEMSTRMIMEKRDAASPEDGDGAGLDFPIPATLQDLLMQRLDNLGPARTLAQLCSAIGREFSRQLLLTLCEANVADMRGEFVQSHLATLIRSGLLLSSGGDDSIDGYYYFRHALVHEAAYQSMWETDRRRLHQEIALTVEKYLPDVSSSQPEVLAYHYEACGAMQDGAKWHWLAARKSKANEAHTESLAHLATAKTLLRQVPVTAQRVKSELDIELTMAGQLIATKGYGAPSVGQCYVAALAHANALKDKKSVLRAQLGLEAYHLMRADFGQAHAYLTQAQNTARVFDDALTQAQCLFALANILHHQGHAQGMQDLCNQCIDVCRASKLRGKLVQSPEVMSLMYSAICVWEMGQVDLARARGQEGVDIARELGQRLGLGQALGLQAMLLLLCGHLEQAASLSEQAISVCEAGDHEMWAAHARIIYGCCISELGDPQRGGDLMDLGYAQWTATGTVITRTFYLALRAPTCALLGRVDQALELINEACRIIAEHGERYYEPEVLRIKAELLLQQQRADEAGNGELADALLLQAQESARELGFPSLGLRVATSLSRRCQEGGNTSAAIAMLQAALAALTQGHDTRDQRIARKLIAQWNDEGTRVQHR